MSSLSSLRKTVACPAILLIAVAVPLGAQAHPQGTDTLMVAAGARVRLSARTLTNPVLIGRLDAVRRDSLWIRYEPAAPPLALSRAAVTHLEVSRGVPGRRSRTLLGAALGVAGGAIFGYVVGGAGGCADCPASDHNAARPRLALFFGALGGAGGGALGSVFGREAWQPGRLPPEAP